MPDDTSDQPVSSFDDRDLRTRAVNDRRDAPLAQPRRTGPLDARLGAPWVLELHLDATTLSHHLEAEQRMLLGRADGNIQPEVDLTPFGGMEHGVSRRHAVLVAHGDRLEIIDLNSTNGTFLNGQRLAPFKPYRLRQGDELHLGDVSLVLTLDVMPVHLSPRWHQPWVRRRSILSADGKGRQVLIAESGAETGAAFKTILEALEYNVQVVENFADAFYAITVRLPDAIILSLDRNISNGLEICRHIQRLANHEHIPMIILSRDTDRARVEELMNAGVDVFLGKPIGVDELVRAVATVTQDAEKRGNEWPLPEDWPLLDADQPPASQ